MASGRYRISEAEERRGMRVNGTVVGLALAAVVALAPAAARPTPTSDERPPIERRDAFFDAAGVDGDTLVAVGKFGKIVRSEDGGREWSIVPSGVARPLFGVAFPTADHGVIVGAGGTVAVFGAGLLPCLPGQCEQRWRFQVGRMELARQTCGDVERGARRG